MTFDRVSKKKATDCTPGGAKIEVNVTKVIDPFTKKEIISAFDGYDTTTSDDVHDCGDPVPSVVINDAKKPSASITVSAGKFSLQDMTVTCDEKVIYSGAVKAGNNSVSLSQAAAPCTLSAIVTDSGYYTATSNSVQYK
jgi:penicillin-binding protein 1A